MSKSHPILLEKVLADSIEFLFTSGAEIEVQCTKL